MRGAASPSAKLQHYQQEYDRLERNTDEHYTKRANRSAQDPRNAVAFEVLAGLVDEDILETVKEVRGLPYSSSQSLLCSPVR